VFVVLDVSHLEDNVGDGFRDVVLFLEEVLWDCGCNAVAPVVTGYYDLPVFVIVIGCVCFYEDEDGFFIVFEVFDVNGAIDCRGFGFSVDVFVVDFSAVEDSGCSSVGAVVGDGDVSGGFEVTPGVVVPFWWVFYCDEGECVSGVSGQAGEVGEFVGPLVGPCFCEGGGGFGDSFPVSVSGHPEFECQFGLCSELFECGCDASFLDV